VVGCEHASFLSSASSLCGNIGDEDEPVIQMGVIVGMRGCLHQDPTAEGGRLS